MASRENPESDDRSRAETTGTGTTDDTAGSSGAGSDPTANPADPGYSSGYSSGSSAGYDQGQYADAAHPLDVPADEQEPAASGRRTRSVGGNRHLTSLVLALVAVPAGYGFLDYSVYRAGGFLTAAADPGRLPDRLIVMIAAAAGCFLVAALAGRISGMGPLVAGLVWGVAPAAWVILDYPSYIDRLNDLPEFWGHLGFGLAGFGIAVFPAVAGLLVAAGLAGKWRRPLPVSRW